MLLPAAVCSMLVAFHGGTTTGGTSTGGTSTTAGSSDGTSTGAATTGTSATSSATTQGSSDGSGTTTSTDGTDEADGTGDLETGPPAEGDEAPSESSDAGVDPTFGPFDESSTDGLDDDFVDGCCDHQDNNSDNFLCRISSGHFDRIALAMVLLLLGRPRRRPTRGAA